LEEITFNLNNIIYKEGDPAEYIYFIKNGQIEISKLIYKENENEYEN